MADSVTMNTDPPEVTAAIGDDGNKLAGPLIFKGLGVSRSVGYGLPECAWSARPADSAFR
jgi:hypothetical protein